MALDLHTLWTEDRVLFEKARRVYQKVWDSQEHQHPDMVRSLLLGIRQQYEIHLLRGQSSLKAGVLTLLTAVALSLWAPHLARELAMLAGGVCTACFWTLRTALRECSDLLKQRLAIHTQVHVMLCATELGERAAALEALRALIGRPEET